MTRIKYCVDALYYLTHNVLLGRFAEAEYWLGRAAKLAQTTYEIGVIARARQFINEKKAEAN